ncbi:MAG TPA: TatD family hydrolase [candidate division Zixibacteria bacterium]|nr:TatD family hydrolase [candidate division Zixibacteria bacterium]
MLIDAHVHLDKYGNDLPRALQEIEAERVLTIAVASDVPSYLETRRIAERSPLVVPGFGIHPARAARYAERLREAAPLIEESPLLGEIGLDFHWVRDAATYPAQRRVFAYFLAAAREQRKAVNLHTKGAEREVLDLLERYNVSRAIVHWYSGPLDILRALAELGAYFTVGVELLYSETIRTVARQIPDDRLLLETDNPGGLKWLVGTSGMPRHLKEVATALAALKGVSFGAAVALTRRNFLRLIAGDPWLAPVARLIEGEPPGEP